MKVIRDDQLIDCSSEKSSGLVFGWSNGFHIPLLIISIASARGHFTDIRAIINISIMKMIEFAKLFEYKRREW